jgi:hypothetical protein
MKNIALSVSTTKSRLEFSLRMGSRRPWWRDLDLDGQSLYRIGNICDTCEVMFEKHNDANLPLAPAELATLLRSGLMDISQTVVDTVAKIIPRGKYSVSLLELQPALIKFKAPKYYIWENIRPVRVPAEWWPYKAERIQPWWYAQPNKSPGFQKDALYEAILPLVSEKLLNRTTIKSYTSAMQDNLKPTALALSVVDVRFVSGRAFDWRLIHFLLDGHHKMMAASRSDKPITLLSFLNIDESFALSQWIERAIQVRYQ